MAPKLAGVHHVKVPVSDPERSREWYSRVFGLVSEQDFVEEGRLMGVSMADPSSQFRFAVRREPERAQALAGYDPVAFGVSTRAELEEWARRLDELGIAHRPIREASIGWIIMGIHDPDGIEVRLYTFERPS